MEDIRRRGRWSQPKSVARYAKPHVLAGVQADTPEWLLTEGAAVIAKKEEELFQALQEAPPAPSDVAGCAAAKILAERRRARRPEPTRPKHRPGSPGP